MSRHAQAAEEDEEADSKSEYEGDCCEGEEAIGRAVAAVSDEFDLSSAPAMHVDASWKLPLPVPGSARFEYGELNASGCSDELKESLSKVAKARGLNRHVEFLVTRAKGDERVPHLRGVASF